MAHRSCATSCVLSSYSLHLHAPPEERLVDGATSVALGRTPRNCLRIRTSHDARLSARPFPRSTDHPEFPSGDGHRSAFLCNPGWNTSHPPGHSVLGWFARFDGSPALTDGICSAPLALRPSSSGREFACEGFQ